MARQKENEEVLDKYVEPTYDKMWYLVNS